ncbi:MAG: putative metalloprotease CJM1_0395 family protein [Alphaproteobacteria bacterium]
MITGPSAAVSFFAIPPAAQNHQEARESSPARAAPASQSKKPEKAAGAEEKLTEEQKRQVQDLKSRDVEVRAHEAAHSAAGGAYTSAPSFEFTTGPDGKRYATAGEVQIDASPVRGNAQATIRKMDVVIRAATAPADPSSQDLAVARKAQAERNAASSELLKSSGDNEAGGPASNAPGDQKSASLALTALAAYSDQQKNDEAARTASQLANLSFLA